MSLLVTPLGTPVPPQSAVQALRRIDPRLGLRFVDGVVGPYFALTERWREDDPRWARVGSGEIPLDKANDILAFLPHDCNPEDAEYFVLRFFGRVKDPAKEAADMVAAAARANAQRKAKHAEEFLVEQEEKHVRTTKHDLELTVGAASAHPVSHGIGEGTLRSERPAQITPVAYGRT